jgi:hypothetical protein
LGEVVGFDFAIQIFNLAVYLDDVVVQGADFLLEVPADEVELLVQLQVVLSHLPDRVAEILLVLPLVLLLPAEVKFLKSCKFILILYF